MTDAGHTPDNVGALPSALTVRDYFAAHCPQWWMEQRVGSTIGEIRDALIERKMIPASRKQEMATRAYTEAERLQLRIALQWEYADAMLAARQSEPVQ